jgi:hypothetical protein
MILPIFAFRVAWIFRGKDILLYLTILYFNLKCLLSQMLVAHACNPSYLGGRDQEDRGLKNQQIVLQNLFSKNLSLKMGWWSSSRCRP